MPFFSGKGGRQQEDPKGRRRGANQGVTEVDDHKGGGGRATK